MGDELPNCRKELALKEASLLCEGVRRRGEMGEIIRMCSFSVLWELEAKFLKGRFAILTHEKKYS